LQPSVPEQPWALPQVICILAKTQCMNRNPAVGGVHSAIVVGSARKRRLRALPPHPMGEWENRPLASFTESRKLAFSNVCFKRQRISTANSEEPFVISIIQRQVSVHSSHSGNQTNENSSAEADIQIRR